MYHLSGSRGSGPAHSCGWSTSAVSIEASYTKTLETGCFRRPLVASRKADTCTRSLQRAAVAGDMSALPAKTTAMLPEIVHEAGEMAGSHACLSWPMSLPMEKHNNGKVGMGGPMMGSPACGSSRSSSPVESMIDSDSNWYAASSSSLATTPMTSATGPRPVTECGFAGDEDCEKSRDKWEDNYQRPPLNRPQTPVDRFKAQQGMAGSKTRGLRNPTSTSHRNFSKSADLKREDPEVDLESETSDSDVEFDDSDHEAEESDDIDNEWSGEDGNLESAVIDAVGGDLGLAAFLIPLLHRSFTPASPALRKKVESWQRAAADSSPKDTEASPGGNSESGRNGTYHSGGSSGQRSNPRKRPRRTSSTSGEKGGSGGGDDDGEEDDNHGEFGGPEPPAGGSEAQRLACPFHKLDSGKYSTRNPESSNSSGKKHQYRTCQGPGFKSIQRLKEHLKRTHYPVQCERCFELFTGKDRAAALQKLTEHRRSEVPCKNSEKKAMDGIDEAQWAVLERQNRKRNQEKHRVEKWFEIWNVLFPNVEKPASPWHEDSPFPFMMPSSPSSESENFTNLFFIILDHKIQQQDINCPNDTRERLRGVVQSAFNLYVSVYGALPRTETSSSATRSNNHLSSLGISRSSGVQGTGASHNLSASTAATSISMATAPPPQLQAARSTPQYALNCNPMSNPPAPSPATYSMTPMMVRQPTGSPTAFSMPPPMTPAGAGLPVGPAPISGFHFAMSTEDANAYHTHAYYNSWQYQPMAPQNFNMSPNMPGTMPGNMTGPEMNFGFGEAQSFGQGGSSS